METVRLTRSLEGKSRQQEGLPSGAVRKWRQGWDPKGPRSWKMTLERWEPGCGGGHRPSIQGPSWGVGQRARNLVRARQ